MSSSLPFTQPTSKGQSDRGRRNSDRTSRKSALRTNLGSEEEDVDSPTLQESDRLLQGGKRVTTHLESYGSWRNTIWTPHMSQRVAAQRWVVVVSALANMAPGGVLVVSRPTGGIFPCLAAFAVYGGLAIFGAHNYAAALIISGSCTLPEVWRKCIGRFTVVIPEVTVAFTCFSCCVGYANFYGHLLSIVWDWNPAPKAWSSPEAWYVFISGLCPMMFLVCLKDISVMRFSTAIAGLSCALVPILAAWRFFDGSYTDTGRWGRHTTITGPPRRGDFWEFHEMPSRLLSIQGVLFLFHFNAAKYFRELEQPKVTRYTWGIAYAIGIAFLIVASTMIFVFLTFGHQTMLITMDNYAKDDHLANVARVAISIGLIGCFPLLFSGMREAIIEFISDVCPFFIDATQTVVFQNILSLLLLVAVIGVANASHRLDLLLINIGRCCCGPLLMYTIPGMIYLGATRRHTTWQNLTLSHVVLTVMVSIFGLVMVVTSSIVWCSYGLT